MDARQLDTRIWRVRRSGDLIDASLTQEGDVWHLRLTRKSRVLAEWTFDTREKAIAVSNTRRREFERAGWINHW